MQPGGQDSQVVVKDLATNIKVRYLLQTADEPPAFISVKSSGWLTGSKEILEKVVDPSTADQVNPTTYKYRVNISLESGDERYAFVNTGMWVGSGCRRGTESEYTRAVIVLSCRDYANKMPFLVIFDSYRVA